MEMDARRKILDTGQITQFKRGFHEVDAFSMAKPMEVSTKS